MSQSHSHEPNRLSKSNSPYLLQHQYNPVDWYEWGDEAFDAARKRNVPIFLSIGYSTCYWCHVMERQVFENAEIAQQMNEQFINVKVDREQRPDLDDLYMTATQIMTQRGGWPMSVFLTPPSKGSTGLLPFWCATYLPPEPMQGIPSFPQVMDALSKAWHEQHDDVIEQAGQLSHAVEQALSQSYSPAPLPQNLVQKTVEALLQTFDQEHAGFGGAPKFPQPCNVALLQRVYEVSGNDPLWPVIDKTLDRMARGGMYDQIGGGFHRYSVDRQWLVPHFEKMLYDNGQLIHLYATAIELLPDHPHTAQHQRIVRESCDYLLREMTHETGMFFSAQDAEVDGQEGLNYLWTPEEIEQAMDHRELADLAKELLGLSLGTNFQDPHHHESPPNNVLFLPESLEDFAQRHEMDFETFLEKREQINASLLAIRDQRKQPRLDNKIITGWNGLAIAGLAKAGRVLNHAPYIDAAGRAAASIIEHLAVNGESLPPEHVTLARTWRQGQADHQATLEDYALLIHGLAELAKAQPNQPRWLAAAKHFSQAAQHHFGIETGGYHDTLADQADLFVRTQSTYDGAIPSGNSVMIHNHLDLFELTGEPEFLQLVALDLKANAQPLIEQSGAMLHMTHAVLRMMTLAPSMIIDSQSEDASTKVGPNPTCTLTANSATIDPSLTQQTIEITCDIPDTFHIMGPSLDDETLVPTSLALTGVDGLTWEVEFPEPTLQELVPDTPVLPIYQGAIAFKLRLEIQDAQALAQSHPTVSLRYQLCDDARCLQPTVIDLALPIK